MAVSIPTDLVLDVVRAASPESASRAEAMLEAAAGRKAASAAEGPAFTREVASLDGASFADLRARFETAAEKPDIPEGYRKFEAMVLGNFVESMLPSDAEALFGKGTAGDIWKSMMAQQIGAVLADGEGIGIAAHLAAERYRASPAAGELAEATVNQAASLVNDLQMTFLEDIGGRNAADDGSGRDRT